MQPLRFGLNNPLIGLAGFLNTPSYFIISSVKYIVSNHVQTKGLKNICVFPLILYSFSLKKLHIKKKFYVKSIPHFHFSLSKTWFPPINLCQRIVERSFGGVLQRNNTCRAKQDLEEIWRTIYKGILQPSIVC